MVLPRRAVVCFYTTMPGLGPANRAISTQRTLAAPSKIDTRGEMCLRRCDAVRPWPRTRPSTVHLMP
jgi:hypothetical protein